MSFIEPGVLNFPIYAGSPLLVEIEGYQKRARSQDGVSFKGHTARMVVRPHMESDDILVELSTENGRIIVSDDSVTLTLSSDETADLTPWEAPAVYDLRLNPPSGRAFFLLTGRVRYVPTVTE